MRRLGIVGLCSRRCSRWQRCWLVRLRRTGIQDVRHSVQNGQNVQRPLQRKTCANSTYVESAVRNTNREFSLAKKRTFKIAGKVGKNYSLNPKPQVRRLTTCKTERAPRIHRTEPRSKSRTQTAKVKKILQDRRPGEKKV